jgi:hypothetical protein
VAILRGLISQLLGQCSELVPYCHEKYLASGEAMLSSIHTAKQLLELLCEKLPRLYLVVDGLDECTETERRVALNYLNGLVDKMDSSVPGKLRLLVVSQEEGDIKKLLATAACLKLSPEHNEADIRSYVEKEMATIQRKFELDRAQVVHITEATCSRSHGKPSSSCGYVGQQYQCFRAGNYTFRLSGYYGLSADQIQVCSCSQSW